MLSRYFFFFTGPPVQFRLSFMCSSVCVCVCVCLRVEWPPRRWSMPMFSLRNGGMCPCVGRPFPHLFPAQPSVCVRADSQHLSLPNARAQWTLHMKSAPRSGCVREVGGGSPDVPLLRLKASVPLFVCAVCVCVLLFSACAGMLFSAVSTVETPLRSRPTPPRPLSSMFSLVFQS